MSHSDPADQPAATRRRTFNDVTPGGQKTIASRSTQRRAHTVFFAAMTVNPHRAGRAEQQRRHGGDVKTPGQAQTSP
jgi:hypothetical protein